MIPSHIIDDDDEDPFESESESEDDPTINPKQSICWSCDVRLYDDIRSESGGKMTYQIHEHPVLQ